MCNKSAAESFPVAVNAVNAVIFLSAIFSPFKINVNPPYFRGECYSRDSRPLALYNYYDATVTATALIPDSTNEEFIVPEAVSLIVPLLSEMFDPPNVRTSVLPKL